MSYENIPTEASMISWLRRLGGEFKPVELIVIKAEPRRGNEDAVVDVDWRGSRHRFAVELKSLSTPKAFEAAVGQADRWASRLGLHPMIVVPYLSDEHLRSLEHRSVSGLDLCGNGVIVVDEHLLVFRTGNPNLYPRGTPIRNVYRGASSIVARTFLLQPEYATAQQLLAEINQRNAAVSLSTVSKVCKALAEDLIVQRSRRGPRTQLRLLQPEKLLDRLVANYRPVSIRGTFLGKTSLAMADLTTSLQDWQEQTANRIVRTGASSTDRYATMVREPVGRFYCTNLDSLLGFLGNSVTETSRFANLELLATEDPEVYFDTRPELVASPIQSYLELVAGDKRERETAQQVRRWLL